MQPMLRAGARGYLLRRSAAEDLVRAIRPVLAGGVYIDPLDAETRCPGAKRLIPAAVPRISARVSTMCSEMAACRDASAKTTETYKTRGCEKLGLRTRADIVRHGAVHG